MNFIGIYVFFFHQKDFGKIMEKQKQKNASCDIILYSLPHLTLKLTLTCQGRSQSSGIGNAPSQAPISVHVIKH